MLLGLDVCVAAPPDNFDLFTRAPIIGTEDVPLISVAVHEGPAELVIESSQSIDVFLGGNLSSKVETKRKRWQISTAVREQGKLKYWVIAEILKKNDPLVERKDHWKTHGIPLKEFTSGRVIGTEAHQIDTSRITLGLGGYDTEKQALDLATKLETVDGIRRQIMSELVKKPTALIRAYDRRKQIQIQDSQALWFSPKKGKVLTVKRKIKKGRKRISRSQRYRGDLYVTVNHKGEPVVVNVLNAEQMLDVVVPSELYVSAPKEALQAQAIAARGQLIVKAGLRHHSDPYLYCAKTHCQAYKDISRERKKTNNQVRATRGQILIDDTGQSLVDTVYSSTCGGHTEAYHEMWGGPPKPSLLGVVDNSIGGRNEVESSRLESFISFPSASYCQDPKRTFRWTKKITGKAVTESVNQKKKIGEVTQIEVLHRGVSGRAIKVRYHGENGTYDLNGSYLNRQLLDKLRSGLWVVDRQGGDQTESPDVWIFKGGGYGHGVGLCQHGAIGAAKVGRSMEEILQHYYPKSTLTKIWN